VTCPVDRIEGVEHLETLLSEPSDTATSAMSRLCGDLIVLGVGGKMGPTLARMARIASDRAGVRRRVIGVARFSDSRLETRLHGWGIETIRCDLLDPAQLDALPDVPNVVFMTGMKFGSTAQVAAGDRLPQVSPVAHCRILDGQRLPPDAGRARRLRGDR